ncbi:BACON domain-containing carbohydrate-binding protein [uncultured Alistipes sp.]|uniref:BACON domain-containing protein n=1 Tax=uncultured Alistipes sp. TaxID=538949 RepID=UPI0025E0E9F4|nr:BACON domain-containing carbohydrate-binding protein [uncultured Alistipes sp.]
MKKILIAFAAAALIFSGCSDDDKTSENADNHKISISTDTINADIDGETAQITVTSTGDWRLAGVSDWVHPSALSGRNGDTVTFTIDPNNTMNLREAKFKFFTGSAVAPLLVTMGEGHALELLSGTEMGASNTAASLVVELSTNIEELSYTFSGDGAEWIEFVKRSDGFGKTKLTFNVKENTDYDDRSSVLTISAPEVSVPVEVNIVQSQLNALLIDDADLMQEFDMSERTFEIEVKSNFDYTVTLSGGWMQRVETRGLVTDRIRIHLDAADASRGGSITIGNSRFPNLSKTITVIQLDPDAESLLVPDQTFRNWLVAQNWVMAIGGDACIVLDAGLAAKTLNYTGSYYSKMSSMKGVEAFQNLTTINVSSHNLTEIDISGLTKVTSLTCASNSYLAKVDLGDNPVKYLDPFGGQYGLAYSTQFTVIGTQIEEISMPIISWYASYDSITSVDVSGCPALQTLNCDRGAKVTSLYLKTGQTIPNLTKNAATQIVYKD